MRSKYTKFGHSGDIDNEGEFDNGIMNCLEPRDESTMDSRYSHDSINAECELSINGDGL
jgi:hypothetical protein